MHLYRSGAVLAGLLLTLAAGRCNPSPQPTDVVFSGQNNAVAPRQDRAPMPPTDAEIVGRWVTALQFSDPAGPAYGAVKIHPTVAAVAADGKQYYRVSPYVSNLGVLGLLRSRTPGSLQTAERWITWFLRHLTPESAPDGVPFEHFYLEDGTGETVCVKPGDPHLCRYNDATDSAAATFFLVLRAYTTAGGRASFLNQPQCQAQINQMAESLLALQQPDGLFWAKRDYRAKYLEDNCEVYAGLQALSELETTVFRDRAHAGAYKLTARRVQQAIEKELYDQTTRTYHIAKFEDETLSHTNLSVWYPDMQAQFWPQLFGVIPASDPRARAITDALDARWNGQERPNWAATPETVNQGHANPDVAFAALLAGDSTQVGHYLQSIRRLVLPHPPENVGFAWPFSVGDAGWLLTLLSKHPIPKDLR